MLQSRYIVLGTPPEPPPPINQPQPSSNYLSTSKYSFISFLPKVLFSQFRKLANVYFLVITIVMIIGYYTPYLNTSVNPWTTLGPFLGVLLISIINEGRADLARHKSDRIINNRLVKRLDILKKELHYSVASPLDSPSVGSRATSPPAPSLPITTTITKESKIKSKDITVANIIIINNFDSIPCDMILLYSSNSGTAYVETSSIDGETNLKLKEPIRFPNSTEDKISLATAKHCLQDLNITLTIEPPNLSIHRFNGSAILNTNDSINVRDISTIPIDINSLLIRGSVLRNTDWAIGIACYTGVESKIAMNFKGAKKVKLSIFDRLVNRAIYFVLFALLILTSVSAALSVYFNSPKFLDGMEYLRFTDRLNRIFNLSLTYYPNTFIQSWFTFLTLYNNIVPLSLYVTFEIIILVLVHYINCDGMMYHEPTNTYANARSTIVSDLGNVNYIFADKVSCFNDWICYSRVKNYFGLKYKLLDYY